MFRRRQEFRLLAIDALCIFLLGLFCPPAPALAGGPTVPGLHGSGGAATPPPLQELPVVRNVVQGISSIEQPVRNKLVVHQSGPKAIVDWESFNIGQEAWTHFDQKGNADWAALNRIYDQNPSLIFGKLTADGKVYLINPNGILFGQGSRVNVHSLVGSTLHMQQEDFLDGLLRFQAEPGSNGEAAVTNKGKIETGELGSVFLVGPTVENQGSIVTPLGQVGLAAGSNVEIAPDTTTESKRAALVVNVKEDPGFAANRQGGELIADQGLVGMYGREVAQEGVARAVTAVKRNGAIELMASDKVTTGPGSVTACPVSDSSEKVHESFQSLQATIKIDGLDLSSPLLPATPVERIEHYGTVEAPSGAVTLRARHRVYLGEDSRIDVSGSWADVPGEANFVDLQLNSVELRDDYGQKGGLLKGKTIQVHSTEGSSIGDISGALSSQEQAALERSTKGGTVEIGAASGDIVVREGASIDFSGGGFRYGSAAGETTKLLSGQRIYDISEAPEWIAYDAVLGSYESRHDRFGIVESFKGLYCGGAAPLRDSVQGYSEGSDAGSLKLVAGRVVLDGTLDGSVFTGPYQTETAEPTSEKGLQRARGRRMPVAGKVQIGEETGQALPENADKIVQEIVLAQNADPLPDGFGPDDPVPVASGTGAGGPLATVLSAEKLSAAGLGALSLNANTIFQSTSDALLTLTPGGALQVSARAIQHLGSIEVPAGTVRLETSDNVTSAVDVLGGVLNPRYVPLRERIDLGAGSRIVAGGQRIDNSTAGPGTGQNILQGRLDAGGISVQDKTLAGEGVVVHNGAVLDVTGGYEIAAGGKIDGGNAGSLELLGSALVLAGDLRGYSLPGTDGGAIALHAENVAIAPSAPALSDAFGPDSDLPAMLRGKLLLADDLLADTGFTHVEVESLHDLTVKESAALAPSRTRLAEPVPASGRADGALLAVNRVQASGERSVGGERVVTVRPDLLGSSSIGLKAGETFGQKEADPGAQIRVEAGAEVRIAPEGEIALSAPGITVAGTLDAPAGKVHAVATQNALVLESGSRILARGTNRPDEKALRSGLPVGTTALPGGEVVLEASQQSIVMGPGSLVDVSGSEPAGGYIQQADGSVSTFLVAGDPGAVILSFFREAAVEGELKGAGTIAGMAGGSLTVRKTDLTNGLTLDAGQVERFLDDGFDALSFQSLRSIGFSGPMDVDIGRSLTLDAPEIVGSGTDRVRMSAPSVRLRNTYWPQSGSPAEGDARLTLSGTWLDVEGSVLLTGFRDVRLEASRDMSLGEHYYGLSPGTWAGKLSTGGDLTLQAARIYPTTLSSFDVRTPGKVTILPFQVVVTGPVYSAGGSLTVEAGAIDQRGVLAAPMGRIALTAVGEGGRVYLAGGSLTTTAGQASVPYGTLDEQYWTIPDKTSTLARASEVDAAPGKSVELSGQEVIVREGAVIDTSGGGKVFGYHFLPGIEGSEDPLGKEGRHVILPDSPMLYPGQAVYLSGGSGLQAGTYSLLPEEYAFLPGALVIEELGSVPSLGGSLLSGEGYGTVTGYAKVAGTDLRSPGLQYYSVRPAADVLEEGHFTVQEIAAGEAGSVTIAGTTTVLNGTLRAVAQPGFQGGRLSLGGQEISIGTGAATLPQGFGSRTPLPGDLQGKTVVASSSLSGHGLAELDIGHVDSTRTITLEEGSFLEAPVVALEASGSITLSLGARLEATGQGGRASLVSPEGSLSVGEGAVVHASESVEVDTRAISLAGDIEVDSGTMSFSGDRIVFAPDGTSGEAPEGLVVSESLWQKFASMENLTFRGRSELLFLGDVAFEAGGDLTLDSPRIAGSGIGDPAAVSLSSGKIHLLNSGSASADSGIADTGSLSLSADAITVGRGSVLLDGFERVSLGSGGDVTFHSAGSLTLGGDLEVSAPRVTVSPYRDGGYEPADFRVSAPEGSILFSGNGGTPGQTSPVGGALAFLASHIEVGGPGEADPPIVLEIPSGRLSLTVSGAGASGVTLNGSARILARGTEYGPGGRVELSADQGDISVGSGALIDVSAAAGGGDAGVVSFSAPQGRVRLEGDLRGEAQGGTGGGFGLDALEVGDFSDLNRRLAEGGFVGECSFRAREGDITVAAADVVRSSRLSLSADKGDITIEGAVDASGDREGGSVEVWVGHDLILRAGSSIDASGRGEGAAGGDVTLGSAGGRLSFENGASIDVSGAGGAGGGRVLFSAGRDGAGVRMDLAGTVSGASRVGASAVQTYSCDGSREISQADLEGWRQDALDFMDHVTWAPALQGVGPDAFRLLPGIEVRSSGDLSLSTPWDLSAWRFGDSAGTLTLRAAGNLLVRADVLDAGSSPSGSWALALAAGADLSGANPLSVFTGCGNLEVADGTAVFTGDSPLRFASGNDTKIGLVSSLYPQTPGGVPFSVATSTGDIRGSVGRDLIVSGGAIQSETGDIRVDVGRDLLLRSRQGALGSIRTLGKLPADFDSSPYSVEPYWAYAGGGDIRLTAGRNVSGVFNNSAWDSTYSYIYTDADGKRQRRLSWGASYSGLSATQGLAAMAGGDLAVSAGGDFKAQAGAFGSGDLRIRTGGDLDGRFLVRQGVADLDSMGSFGLNLDNMAIEAFDSRIDVTAQGSIALGTVVNPTIARDKDSVTTWNLTYTEDAALRLHAVTGDVSLSGINDYYTAAWRRELVLPPTVDIEAGGSIHLTSPGNGFFMPPSPIGNLSLVAGADISGQYFEGTGAIEKQCGIYMSDLHPSEVYGVQASPPTWDMVDSVMLEHAATPVHLGDPVPIEITAGRDIRNLGLWLTKQARITAGRDIREIYAFCQNISPGDVTAFTAGRNIRLIASPNAAYKMGIVHGGPGFLLVQAADSIDLGTSEGITSLGNKWNTSLGVEGSSLAVVAGYDLNPTRDGIAAFFASLEEAGTEYSKLLAQGDPDAARARVEEARKSVIEPFLGGTAGGRGEIDMINSQINTSSEMGDLYVIARGDVNVGRTTFVSDQERKNTGIYTASGGAIDLFAGGDLNVNESRIMTFRGGDIVAWSDRGNINAGRGSKTAINAEPPRLVLVGDVWVYQFNPPAVGSGIRAVTYDPDGAKGPQQAPPAGDIALFAPEGEIDAGEAGISGSNVILGATAIVNAQNIQFSVGSVGFSAGAASAGGMGALSGAGSLTDTAKMAEEAVSIDSTQEQLMASSEDTAARVVPKWLDVKVVEFVDDGARQTPGGEEEEKKDEKE